jgi:3-oxoacyl-[acyl-carrier-protein] synthase-1
MSQANQVFITGYAALSAGGHDVEGHWQSLLQGETKIAPSSQASIEACEHHLTGEVRDFNWNHALPDRKLQKVISKQDVMGLYAAIQASNHSGLTPFLANGLENDISVCDRTAVFVGSPGNKYCQQYDFIPLVAKAQNDMRYFGEHLFEEVHPMWLLRILPNNVLAYAGIQLGCKGVNHNFTNHVVGGLQALIEAYWAIQTGQADRALVIAYDIAQEAQGRFYYDQLGVLSRQHLRPFDKSHDGTILAEGAAAIVLESEQSVALRQVKPLAQFLGGKAITEGVGLFSLSDDGQPLAQLMQDVLEQQSLSASDIDMLVAHGNGNQKSDDSEAKAIAQVFGEKTVPVTAFKWLMGHTLCASGLLDVVLSVKALEQRTIPPIPNFEHASSFASGLDVVHSERFLESTLPKAMVLSRGFGGMDASVLLKACS